MGIALQIDFISLGVLKARYLMAPFQGLALVVLPVHRATPYVNVLRPFRAIKKEMMKELDIDAGLIGLKLICKKNETFIFNSQLSIFN